jgi:hypothetical protein
MDILEITVLFLAVLCPLYVYSQSFSSGDASRSKAPGGSFSHNVPIGGRETGAIPPSKSGRGSSGRARPTPIPTWPGQPPQESLKPGKNQNSPRQKVGKKAKPTYDYRDEWVATYQTVSDPDLTKSDVIYLDDTHIFNDEQTKNLFINYPKSGDMIILEGVPSEIKEGILTINVPYEDILEKHPERLSKKMLNELSGIKEKNKLFKSSGEKLILIRGADDLKLVGEILSQHDMLTHFMYLYHTGIEMPQEILQTIHGLQRINLSKHLRRDDILFNSVESRVGWLAARGNQAFVGIGGYHIFSGLDGSSPRFIKNLEEKGLKVTVLSPRLSLEESKKANQEILANILNFQGPVLSHRNYYLHYDAYYNKGDWYDPYSYDYAGAYGPGYDELGQPFNFPHPKDFANLGAFEKALKANKKVTELGFQVDATALYRIYHEVVKPYE